MKRSSVGENGLKVKLEPLTATQNSKVEAVETVPVPTFVEKKIPGADLPSFFASKLRPIRYCSRIRKLFVLSM